jgi:hypothetical protein
VWAVTTEGDLPDEHELRLHEASATAWDDYRGRILELAIHGYAQESEGAAEYGRRWICELRRGTEQIAVHIARSA